MAQHNFISTLKHIAKCLSLDLELTDKSKKIIDELKDKVNSLTQDKKLKFYELLNKHFPFLAPMIDSDKSAKDYNEIKAINDILPQIGTVVDFYRDYTTHYDPDEEKSVDYLHPSEQTLVPRLKELLKAEIRTVQQRFNYVEDEVLFIKNKEMDKERYRYCLFKKLCRTDKKVFSRRGLVFFISLFLEKKYINEMLNKTKDFYAKDDLFNDKRKHIIFESLAVYRIRLPRNRYESQQDDVGLALDMVNELQRCPKELFDLLSTEDQIKFRPDASDEDSSKTAIMIRHADRFPKLAMNYIDQCNVFNSIRFQVNLGKYRYAFYNKKCIDGLNHVRSLQKELHGFGKLNEIEKARLDTWGNLIRDFEDIKTNTIDTMPYINDQRASYIINNNRIGLYWEDKDDVNEPKLVLPKLPNEPTAKNLRQQKANGERIVLLQSPKCFMSTHELPALIFYHIIRKKHQKTDSPDVESIIIKWVEGFRNFIQEVMDGKITSQNAQERANQLGINYAQHLPKKIQEYLDANQDNNNAITANLQKKLKNRLTTHIDETKKLIEKYNNVKHVDSKKNKRGTKRFVEIKQGRLGAWLAQDIIALQPAPADGNNKLTGLNFQLLQSALSIYDNFDNLKRLLIAAHLIQSKGNHPFLSEIVSKSPQTIGDFYQAYLKAKLNWLNSLLSEEDLIKYPFLTRGVNKWKFRDEEYYKSIMQQYLELPAELPRGLFETAIKDILIDCFGRGFVRGNNREEANVAFLIAKYFKKVFNDDYQEFYTQPDGNYKRHYYFFKLLLQSDKDYGKTVKEIEDILRTDMSLTLLSKTTIENDDDSDNSDNSDLKEYFEEINKKLAKSLAKDPTLDKRHRIEDIISKSETLSKLPNSQQKKLLRISSKRHGVPINDGLVKKHIKKITSNSEKEEELKKLSHALHKLKSTERLIRRYRVQDIIIFMMAREILFENDKNLFENRFEEFKLKNIRPIRRQEGVGALEIKVPFAITLHIKGSNESVVIRQKSIKLKNYGDFHKFLYDNRIETLIPYLRDDANAVKVTIDRDELEHEFETYDKVRLDVFESVHKIERLILERYPELHDKRSSLYYFEKKGVEKPIPKKNNFRQLIECEPQFAVLDKDDCLNIRNSFSHNSYNSKDHEKVNIPSGKIGEIAELISERMKTCLNNFEKKTRQENDSE